MGEKEPRLKYEFAKGRQTTEAVLAQLVEATGAAPEELLAAIRPLQTENLGVVVRWASDLYNLEHPNGPANAKATDDYIVVQVWWRDVDGKLQDTTGVQRSHLIDTAAEDLACQSFEAFDDATKWLAENVIAANQQLAS